MLQTVTHNAIDGHPDVDVEARTAIEVCHLYGLLASLFRAEPTRELLQLLRSPDLAPLLIDAGFDIEDELGDGMDDDTLLEQLAVEYAALFLGPGGHISPHESVHADPAGGKLWGDETVAVKRYIEALDLSLDDDYRGLPDHISVELDLMASLVGHEARGWEQGDLANVANALAYQQEFMQEHLLRWVPLFCRKVIETSGMAFYRDLARVTRDFLASEAEDILRRKALAEEQQEN
jgi:TorA maturation chaperone TorD